MASMLRDVCKSNLCRPLVTVAILAQINIFHDGNSNFILPSLLYDIQKHGRIKEISQIVLSSLPRTNTIFLFKSVVAYATTRVCFKRMATIRVI